MGLLKRLILLLLLPAMFAPPAYADHVDENALRAAMVYNILRFITWPDEAAAPLQFCLITRREAVSTAFLALNGRTVAGRPLILRTLGPLTNDAGCHSAYVDELEGGLAHDRIRWLLSQRVLTFNGDPDPVAASAAHVNIALSQNHLVFDINLASLNRIGIQIPARLLQLARTVQR